MRTSLLKVSASLACCCQIKQLKTYEDAKTNLMATPSCDGYKEVKEMKGEDLEDVGTVFGVTGGDEDFQSGNDNEEGG